MTKPTRQSSINLKLPDDLKEKTKIRAHIKQQTVSKFIRELLSSHFDGTLCKSDVDKNARQSFINSTEFLKLIVWMYTKKSSNAFKETQLDLESYIETLKKTAPHFPKELVSEFDKVLFDLIRVSKEESEYSKDYKFSKGYRSALEFNYELLEKYLLDFETPMIVSSFK
ncbi:hypothetical protein [Algibacter mikhailovii]|uniref:hypothetical protein n=1 Tax=Algibacter mikhailovii TaxID=425498 RepID=UPI0024954AF3|nr:hypothetical protein [Algibacter mikhailovii]